MIKQIDMDDFKTKMEAIAKWLKRPFNDTNERVQKWLEENEYKVYGESHIQKVRAGQKYVPEIVEALIEVAEENSQKYDTQIARLQKLAEL